MTTTASSAAPALVLYAHGARDPAWADPLARLVAHIGAASPVTPVELAFLEHMAPDLSGAVGRLLGRGATEIVVVPVFLGQGGHVRRDVPAQVSELQRAHPGVAIRCAPAIGEDPGVIAALGRYCLDQLYK